MKRLDSECKFTIGPGEIPYASQNLSFNLNQKGLGRGSNAINVLRKQMFTKSLHLTVPTLLDFSQSNIIIETNSDSTYTELIFSLLNPQIMKRSILRTDCALGLVLCEFVSKHRSITLGELLYENLVLSVYFKYFQARVIKEKINYVLGLKNLEASYSSELVKSNKLMRIFFEIQLELGIHHFIILNDLFQIEDLERISAKYNKQFTFMIQQTSLDNSLPEIHVQNVS
jgi:hypothetical protein